MNKWPISGRAFAQDLLLGLRCGYLAIDRQGLIQELNPHACTILDIDPQASIGRPIEVVLGENLPFAKILLEAFQLDCLPNRAELDLRCRSKKKTIGFTLSLIQDSEGVPYGAAVLFKDLTRIEKQEEQERLKDRLAALGQMAANMAHEIRNPLASIEVSCSLLSRRFETGSEERSILEKIVSEVRRLNGTIHSSLEFVKPLDLKIKPVDLYALLSTALQVATSRVESKSVNYCVEIEPSLPEVRWDVSRVRQVFENLLINALEAMEGSGSLWVRAKFNEANDSIQVEIQDTGPGIPEELKDRLFYPFFTTKTTGSGVGLSVARKIIEAHQGFIDLKHPTEGGALFEVQLPLDATSEVFTS